MKKIKLASLFSGIGGFELGLSWSIPNLEVTWQVEIDDFCRSILANHFPESKQYKDIRTFDSENEIDKNIHILVGGFPCQDISLSNSKREGLDGKKSGLFWEMLRIIRLLRPPIIIMENVAGILIRNGGMGRVLGSMAELGYNCEWFCLEAQYFGLPHKRRRVFIVAYSTSQRSRTNGTVLPRGLPPSISNSTSNTNSTSYKRSRCAQRVYKEFEDDDRLFSRIRTKPKKTKAPKPTICGMANGVSKRLHNNRLKALGNSIVPQKTEWIGRRLLETGLIHDLLGQEYITYKEIK